MKRKVGVAAAILIVAVAGASTYAWARGQDAATIYGCVANADGKLRIVPTAGACKNGESELSWNSVGPMGPAGRDGRDGVQGPPGASAAGLSQTLTATMTVTGHIQGSFSNSPMVLVGLSHEIVSPRDPASGLPTGKRQHKPITITKEWDASSPKLLQALFTNENLTEVLIGLKKGGQTVATIKLTNASISDRHQFGEYEEVAFTYQKITWTWVDGGITAEDDWEAPVS